MLKLFLNLFKKREEKILHRWGLKEYELIEGRWIFTGRLRL